LIPCAEHGDEIAWLELRGGIGIRGETSFANQTDD
jgi:hypothetical protein